MHCNDPASTLIIAGEAVPCIDRSQKTDTKSEQADAAATADARSQRLVDVVNSRRRDRWQAPDLEGPEFGGLIERRGVDTRGLMPQKYTAENSDEHRRQAASKSAAEAGAGEQPATAAGESLESTGMFLASLDNSAITLADSGLFRIAD